MNTKKTLLTLIILSAPIFATAQTAEEVPPSPTIEAVKPGLTIADIKPGMTKEDVLEIAGKPMQIIFIGIDKTSADSLFSYQYSTTQFVSIVGNKVEGVDLDMEKTKLQVDSLINRKIQD